MPDFPIVLHGSSTVPQAEVKTINTYGGNIKNAIGIPESELTKAAKQNVCKINIDSGSRLTITASVRKVLSGVRSEKILVGSKKNAKKVYKHLIKDVLRLENKL